MTVYNYNESHFSKIILPTKFLGYIYYVLSMSYELPFW